MALPGSSATVGTPGDVVATNTVSSKEYQVMILADESGHMLGSKDTYFYNIASSVHVAAASTLTWDIFNADPALLVRVILILPIVDLETAVTGVGFEWQILRTTAVGTAGTAQTAWLPDTAQTALDVDITCRLKATGGATASTSLLRFYTNSEETLAGNQLFSGVGSLGNVVPQALLAPNGPHGILLRQNQGLRCNQETNSAAGNTAWLIGFTVE